jgi:hypothetical protein
MLDGEISFPEEFVLKAMKLMLGGRTIFFVLLDDLGFGDVLQKGGVRTFTDEFLILLSVCLVLFSDDFCLSFSDFCHEFDVIFARAFDFLYEDFFVLIKAVRNGVL